jgi:legumain
MLLRSLSFGLAVAATDAANHAVIAAGSRYYSNYRHQADACHAYQVMRAKGIPAENIVMMMYDDVATSESNPFPGKLFNKPSDGEGYDVYAGCEIDYRGDDVTPENFLAVLTGTASGKKLESTEEDNVFIFFVDHGAPGLISFPSDDLHKVQLQNALQQMSDAKMFKKLVFYLETCESGSMFEDMSIPNVYAVSAANPTESSWGTYCGYDATVNGTRMNSCLGDLFAVTWMEDSEASDTTIESLDDQFQKVLTSVTKSHPMQWSDTTFTSDHVSDFIGTTATQQQRQQQLTSKHEDLDFNNVKTRLTHLVHLYLQYQDQPSSEMNIQWGMQLHSELTQQLNARAVYRRLVEIAYPHEPEQQQLARTAKHKPENMECEKEGLKAVRDNCAGLFAAHSGFALQFHQQVVNICHDISFWGLNLDIKGAAEAACRDVGTMGFAAASGLVV